MSVPITITILDENDNDPQFSRSSYQIYVTENANSLASANIIRVTDIDEGANAKLELTSNYFEITPENDASVCSIEINYIYHQRLHQTFSQ